MSKPSYALPDRNALAFTLRELRRERSSHTQESISALLGVSRGTVANWEVALSEPTIEALNAMLAEYGYQLVARPKSKR